MIVATFASLIARVQQVIDAAAVSGRKVFVTGRSMIDNVAMARERGYLDFPREMIAQRQRDAQHAARRGRHHHDRQPGRADVARSRAWRTATTSTSRSCEGDTVVLSASPIPGNEALVYRTVDNLFRLGADVLYNRVANIHVRGHAAQEELKIIQALVKPKYFVPDPRRVPPPGAARAAAREMGVEPKRTRSS